MAADVDIEKLYRDYGDLVFGRCRSLLGNEADAQETMQEIFIRLMRYAPGFRGDAKPSTYLFKITTTTCLNRLRTKRRRREDPVEELPPTASTDTLLEDAALRNLLDVLLRDADERTTSAVIYCFVDGMTHAEAGELIGISAAAVRKRIAKFRKAAKAKLPHGWEEGQ
ncbi:MAG: sigma-70 family RNA polymerase sigma factor [Myxococcota bacterium]